MAPCQYELILKRPIISAFFLYYYMKVRIRTLIKRNGTKATVSLGFLRTRKYISPNEQASSIAISILENGKMRETLAK